jgi:hypothetical protein
MMNFWLRFFIGGACGVFTMALMNANKGDSE